MIVETTYLKVKTKMDFNYPIRSELKQHLEHQVKLALDPWLDKSALVNIEDDFILLWTKEDLIKRIVNQSILDSDSSDIDGHIYNDIIDNIMTYQHKINSNKQLKLRLEQFKAEASRDKHTLLRQAVEKRIAYINNLDDDLNDSETSKTKNMDQHRSLHSELSRLEESFAENLERDRARVRTIQYDLTGMTETLVQTIQNNNRRIRLSNNIVSNALSHAASSETRHYFYDEYNLLGRKDEFNNAQNMVNILNIRLNIAKTQGHNNYCELALSGSTVGRPEDVKVFLNQSLRDNAQGFHQELKQLSEFALKNNTSLRKCDIPYFIKKYRAANNAMSIPVEEYFSLNTLLKGTFQLLKQLFSLELTPIKLAANATEILAFTVHHSDLDESILVLDLFESEHKTGQSSQLVRGVSFKIQENIDSKVIQHNDIKTATIVCHFPKNRHSLLEFDQIKTLFHEIGHAIHCLFAEKAAPFFSDISETKMDSLEIPSQWFEQWVFHEEFMTSIAQHYISKKKLSQHHVKNWINQNRLFSHIKAQRDIEYALFDIHLHSHCHTFELSTLNEMYHSIQTELECGETGKVSSRLFYIDNSFYYQFEHIFCHGYASHYYAYLWSASKAKTLFGVFENSFHDKKTLSHLGKMWVNLVLSSGTNICFSDSIPRFLHSIKTENTKSDKTLSLTASEI